MPCKNWIKEVNNKRFEKKNKNKNNSDIIFRCVKYIFSKKQTKLDWKECKKNDIMQITNHE